MTSIISLLYVGYQRLVDLNEDEKKEVVLWYRGVGFPKLNWSAPKDGAWTSLKYTNFSEIALLLCSSDSVVHDLCHDYDSCMGKTGSRPSRFFIALCKWYFSLHPKMEFRCFVHHKVFVFDVYVTRDGRVKLLDFNPWGAPTLPLLFTWDELE
ncbi:hypothetical protein ACS0TY_022498 [Phlomoides rotata]